jgi:hypothetical protein
MISRGSKFTCSFLEYQAMKIVAVPAEFRGFFNRFRDLFTLRQFHYFRIYVYSLIVLQPEQKSISGISQAWVEPVSRSSLERVLCEPNWEFSKVKRRAGTQLISVLSQRKKSDRFLTLVVDDTTLLKFGQSIFGACWYKKHKNDPSILGLQVVVVGVLVEGWLVPVDFRIYMRQCDCEPIKLRFETKLQQAASMLKNLQIPREYKCEVMFDTWYLNSQVTDVITSRRWTWISKCAPDRSILLEDESKRQQLQSYTSSIEWEKLSYKTNRKRPAVVGHQRIGDLRGIGRVKIVISSLVEDGSGKWAFFCTNNTRLPMVTVIKHYESRWKVEVFFKEARKCFAFGRWQYRDVVSVVHHLCLTLVAAIACACIRLKQLEQGEADPAESWGSFTRKLQRCNQRSFLKHFLEKQRGNDDSKFNELCEAIGL